MEANKASVLAAVSQDGEALEHAHESMKKDKEVVLAAVNQDGVAVRFAHESMKKDKDVVLAAVKQHGCALEHAHDSLKKDKEVVLAAAVSLYSPFGVEETLAIFQEECARLFQEECARRVGVFKEELVARVWHPAGRMFKYDMKRSFDEMSGDESDDDDVEPFEARFLQLMPANPGVVGR